MSSINIFKLLNQKCEKYFDFFQKEFENEITLQKNSDKERFGFYFYILENILKIKDFNEIVEYITDTDFNKALYNKTINDFGVDAIHINDEENVISIFNFKFRENFKPNKSQELNEPLISTKFTNSILNNELEHLEGDIKIYASQIIDKLNSKEVWTFRLYIVSNEMHKIDVNDPTIKSLEKTYDLEIVPIALPEIENYLSIRPEPISSSLIIDNDAIMSFSENTLSSDKSYIIRLSIPELIRITSIDKKLREETNLEDYSVLSNTTLDFSVLFDNVRGYLGETKYNSNIINTLKQQPSKFFMFNNGITITASDIKSKPINGNRKIILEVLNFKVVNGGQTLRSIHNFNSVNENHLSEYINDCEILVRIFKTGDDPQLLNNIAEYTNSQNSISSIDLKSLASEQILIEQFLDDVNIVYARKSGDTGKEEKDYLYKISMEKFAQILFSKFGFPEKASNQKKKIFEKYYDFTFKNENFNIEDSASYIKRYFEIKKFYEESKITFTDQKIFYILYLDIYFQNVIKDAVDYLETKLREYKSDVPDTRKLIQIKFKEFIDLEIAK